MYAIVKSGARQYRASAGSTILVERLPGEVGQQVELRDVMLVAGDGEVKIGRPTVAGAKVIATIMAQEKGPKIRIFKYRPKERYRRRIGHRQLYTRLRVDRIVV